MSEDTKLKELIINTLSPEQMPEVLSETEIYLVEDDVEYATVEELEQGLAGKQDVGDYALKSELPTKTSDLTNDSDFITTSYHDSTKQDVGDYALKSELPTKTSDLTNDSDFITTSYHDSTKQDVITDLSDIRNNIATNTSNISYLDEKVRDIELFKFPNAVIIGEPTIQNGQVSGFSTASYLQFPFILDLHNQAFQIDFCFTTATNVQTQQNILDSKFGLALAIQNGKGVMAISSNGTSWDIGSTTGTINIQSNTTYYARLIWNRLQYKTQLSTDGVNYVDDMVIIDTRSPYPRTMFIGGCDIVETGHAGHPFLGTINMNKATLSIMGNVIWQGMDDAGLATRADLSLSNLDELGEKRFTDLEGEINAEYQARMEADSQLAEDINKKVNTSDLATVATSGSYNDLSNKPTIPSAVTESTVSGWGFTKNAGTITGIKMNGASKGTSGVVDLGTVITSHQSLDSCVKTSGNQTVAGEKTFTGNPVFSNATYGASLTVNRNAGASATSAIKFSNNEKRLGYIGINANERPFVEALSGGGQKLLVQGGAYGTAVGSSSQPVYISSAGVATAVTNKTWTGTLAQYNAITTKDANTLYYITDDDNVNMTVYLKTAYVSGTSGYNIYSNGYCEQWGYLPSTATNHQTRTITFLKTFKDTSYNYQQTTGNNIANNTGYGVQWGWIVGTKTPSSIQTDTASTSYQEGTDWRACGYLAEGQY